MLRIVGETDKGHPVIAGVWRFFETYGMPLDCIFDSMKQHGFVPSIPHLLIEAEKAGCNSERFRERVTMAYRDAYEYDVR